MQVSLSPINVEDDEELIKLLEDLGNLRSEYPAALLAPRRASLIAQVEQWYGRIDRPTSANAPALIEMLL